MVDSPKDDDGPPGPRDGETPPRTSFFGLRRSLQSPGDALQPEAAPPPPPPTRRKRRPIVATASGILSFLGIAAVAAIALFSLGLQRIHAPGPLPADKVVYIESGTDTAAIVDQLEHEGVVDSWPLMTATLYFKREHKPIKAGEYLFKQNASLSDVVDVLISGKQVLHAITIPEGLTSEQIVQRLRDNDVLVGSLNAVPPEGTLMPDTFKFARGTSRETLIRSMQSEQKRIVAEVWAHRAQDTPIKSPFEMLTLASIVEKETGRADERPRVAGVFVNRLLKNMPLQSDPTIVYGLVGGKGTLGRGILRSELDQRTPYNTYLVAGLPPGPICNPGRAAMEAVANPSRTKEVYFVADGSGGHVFAETLDQHRQNVQRWRQIEKDAKDKATPDDKALQSAPAGASAPKQNQRGELVPAVPVYGALNSRFVGSHDGTLAVRLMDPSDYPLTLSGSDRALSQLNPVLAATASPDASDELNAIPGAGTGQPRAMSAEEEALAQSGRNGGTVTFPVSAARRAEERAQATQYGLAPGSDKLPPETELISTDPAAAAVRSPKSGPGKGHIVDASEGTHLDPLLNKTYDLNSPKTVPTFKPVGGGAVVAN